jgi:hypothetical protein
MRGRNENAALVAAKTLLNKIVPDLKPLETVNFFEKSPLLIPEPLAVEKRQRPFPCP